MQPSCICTLHMLQIQEVSGKSGGQLTRRHLRSSDPNQLESGTQCLWAPTADVRWTSPTFALPSHCRRARIHSVEYCQVKRGCAFKTIAIPKSVAAHRCAEADLGWCCNHRAMRTYHAMLIMYLSPNPRSMPCVEPRCRAPASKSRSQKALNVAPWTENV
jgi:hypothetical protein